MSKKEIAIEQLEIGMFVTALDVSWLKTPFFKHSMLIDNELQIVALKNCGAKLVTIDIEKGKQPSKPNQPADNKVIPPAEKTLKPTSLHNELETAKHIKESAKKAMQSLFAAVQEGGTPKIEIVSSFVNQTIDSLSRNSQALINIFLSKRQSSKLYTHAFNVMSISLLLAQKLGYSQEEQKQIGLAALLMDIGWLKIPGQFFTFHTAYTNDEFSFTKKHVDYSLQLIEKGDFDPEIHQAIAQHHERYNGDGYPAGLGGEQIHPMSRILSLADNFDSLANGYYDKSPIIPARALQEIYKKALQSSHEPSLVQLLISLIGVYPPSSAVLLNTGERGVVTVVNWRAPLAPRVKIFYNKTFMPLMRPFEVDLAKQENESTIRKIQAVIDPTLPGQDPAGLLGCEE
ncbi:HD-GYP domain-containing protein [Gammaproteobacteria bacterium]